MAQQLTTAEFDSVLANADKPVLVDFGAVLAVLLVQLSRKLAMRWQTSLTFTR